VLVLSALVLFDVRRKTRADVESLASCRISAPQESRKRASPAADVHGDLRARSYQAQQELMLMRLRFHSWTERPTEQTIGVAVAPLLGCPKTKEGIADVWLDSPPPTGGAGQTVVARCSSRGGVLPQRLLDWAAEGQEAAREL
jgi:hypothetical protein